MIELIIINSLIIWGVFTSLQDDMIFGKIGNWIRGKYELVQSEVFDTINTGQVKKPIGYHLPSWIKKPLATCPICMSSVYGTPVFWSAYYTNQLPLIFAGFDQFYLIIIFYICYIFAIAGLNYLILAFMPND